MMTDPAVTYQHGQNYGTFDRGTQQDIFMKNPNGSVNLGIVWPGVTVSPDWFNSKTQAYVIYRSDLYQWEWLITYVFL